MAAIGAIKGVGSRCRGITARALGNIVAVAVGLAQKVAVHLLGLANAEGV